MSFLNILIFTKKQEAYDLDGNQYSTDDILKMYRDVTEEFKFEHPSFIGLKIIYSANKAVANDFEKYFNILRQLHKNFPTFVIGFDMVGQEVMCLYTERLITWN